MIDFYILCTITGLAMACMFIVSLFPKCTDSCGHIGRYNDKELMDKLSQEAKQER